MPTSATWLPPLQACAVALEQHVARQEGKPRPGAEPLPPESMPETAPPALEVLCRLFGLSSFERSVVVLCAGVELDAAFASLCAVRAVRSRSVLSDV